MTTPVSSRTLPALDLVGLTRHYPSGAGISDVTLRLLPGEIHVLAGANGAGKTTTLSVLAGTRYARMGALRLGEHTVRLDRLSPRPGLGFVADRPLFDPRLTPYQWLRFVMTLRHQTDDLPTTVHTAAELADVLQLPPPALQEPIGTLSFGTQRKVALWTEMLATRAVLLLDEPLTGLDPLAIEGLHSALRTFCAHGGAVLLSTHLLREAEALASHAAIMHMGRITAAGPMSTVRGDGSFHDAFLRHAAV